MVNGFVVSDNFVVLIRLDDVSLAREKRIQFNCSESNDWQRISLGYSLFIISWLFLFTNKFFASFSSVGFVQRETNSLKYWLWRVAVEIWNVTSLRFDEQTFLLLFCSFSLLASYVWIFEFAEFESRANCITDRPNLLLLFYFVLVIVMRFFFWPAGASSPLNLL